MLTIQMCRLDRIFVFRTGGCTRCRQMILTESIRKESSCPRMSLEFCLFGSLTAPARPRQPPSPFLQWMQLATQLSCKDGFTSMARSRSLLHRPETRTSSFPRLPQSLDTLFVTNGTIMNPLGQTSFRTLPKLFSTFCRCRAMTCMPFGGELGVLTASHANRKGHPLFAFGHAFLHSTLASFCREAVQHRHQFMSTFGKDERTRNCQNCFRTCESYGCPRSRQFWMLQPLSPTITVSHLDAQDLGCGSKKMISLRLGIRGTLGNRCLPGLTSNSNGAFWAFHHRCRRPNYRRRWMVLTSNAEPCDDKDRLGLLEQNWTLIARQANASTRTSRYFDPSLLLPKSLFCDRGSVSRTPSKSMTLGLDQSARTQSSSFLRELTKRSSSTSSRSSRTLKMFKVSMRTSRRFRKQLDLSTPKQLNRSARRPSFVRTSKTPRHPSRRPSRKLSRIRPKALWPPSKRCCKLENAQHRAGNAPSHSTRMTPWRDEQIGCSHVIQRFCRVWRLTFCQGMQPLWIQWNILFTVQLCFRGLSTLLHYRSNSRIFAVQYLSCRLGSVWRRQTQITLFYAEFTMPHWLQYDISNMHFDWSFAALSHLPCPRVVSWHSHLWATHVGEATNPGPAEQSRSEDFYVCIANITKLRKHADEVHRLYASFPGITCLAETSADESAIQHFSRSCRWKSLEYHSGSPCGLRGKKYSPPRPEFGGVGIITSPKSRRPTSQLKLEEWCSTRYLETIVQARGFQILVVAMYLHPLADDIHNAKRDINEALMARAAERVGIWGGHAIIAGDLNVPPRTTTLWQFLSPRGWVEAHQHADETLGTPTMPTCRESTWNDTIFFSPSLAPAIREISTFRKFILPTHAPLVTALDLGGVPDTYTIWKTIQPIQLEQLQALREIQYDEFFVDAMCELGQDTSVPDEATMPLPRWRYIAPSFTMTRQVCPSASVDVGVNRCTKKFLTPKEPKSRDQVISSRVLTLETCRTARSSSKSDAWTVSRGCSKFFRAPSIQ